MKRRDFISTAVAATAGLGLATRARAKGAPRILLRSSWQTVNIGDIAHTPGMLALLEKHLPEAEVRLWPRNVDNGVEEMLKKRFPKVAIVKDEKSAFADSDFLLHGSGPSLVAEKDVAKWKKETGKPYGVGGITFSGTGAESLKLLSDAKFVYFRDSVSLKFAKDKGVTCPVMAFGPDGAFGVDLRNDEAATAFLKANGLEDGKFMCVIPRLRSTPYWKIHGKAMTATDDAKHVRNEKMKEHDHAALREAICAVVRQTEMKILVCPEDKSQMEIGKEMLVDKLPDDVKPKVVWHEKYWLTDEALSTYVRSAGLFGNEMHSPIMCVGNGIPAIVCRWAEQTSKGYMWRDIGLNEWLFNMDEEEEIKGIVPAVLGMAKDPAGAKVKTAKAREFVMQKQVEMMGALRAALG